MGVRNSKKAQSAIEFLSNYGWVILVGISSVVILSNMGAFRMGSCERLSYGFSQIVPTDWVVSLSTSSMVIVLENWAGDQLEITKASVVIADAECSYDGSVLVEPGANAVFTLNCSEKLKNARSIGECYTSDVSVEYKNARSGNSDTSKGKLRGTIEDCGDNCLVFNGQPCSDDSECYSKNCQEDYDSSGSWCVASDSQCAHAGIIYNNGANLSCCAPNSRRYCNAGTWVCESCGTDGCRGTCGAGINGCVWTENYCSGSSCGSNNYDVDSTQARCDSCLGAGNYGLGGEVAASDCCGDDIGEYKATESQGIDAPSSFDEGTKVCCDTGTDCTEAGACYATGSTSGNIPNRGYCADGTWQGGDAGSAPCSAIVGAGYWSLGGDTSPATCCGDDAGEYKNTEIPGSDAPALFDDGTNACCDANTDCVESDACTSNISTTGAIPNKGYCNNGTWQGGDAGNTQCNAITGAGRWSIGGEVSGMACCGDDLNENKVTRSCTNGCSPDAADIACCDAFTDCVYSSVCYADGSYAPANGNLRCNAGSWIDDPPTVELIEPPIVN
jgi:hypothetical protein